MGYVTNNHVAAANSSGVCPAQLSPARTPTFGRDQCQPGRLDAPNFECSGASYRRSRPGYPDYHGGIVSEHSRCRICDKHSESSRQKDSGYREPQSYGARASGWSRGAEKWQDDGIDNGDNPDN